MRRAVLMLLVAPLVAANAPAAPPAGGGAAAPSRPGADGRTLAFDIYRGNSRIGSHTLQFTQTGDVLTVAVAIDIRARVLFVPFSYSMRNTEQWRGNRLVSLESRTTTNDKVQTARARATASGLELTSTSGQTRLVAPGTLPTTYWYGGTVRASQLINSQKGELLTGVTAAPAVAVRLPAPGGSEISAREYAIRDDRKFAVNLAYDANACLVGLNFRFPVTNDRIVYRLVARPRAEAAPDLAANPLLAPCLQPALRTAQQGSGA